MLTVRVGDIGNRFWVIDRWSFRRIVLPPGARGLRPTVELNPGNRIGPEKLWATFGKALDQLGIALEGDGFAQLAAVLGSLSAAATEIADELDAPDQISQTG
jgi:hypothetical protein